MVNAISNYKKTGINAKITNFFNSYLFIIIFATLSLISAIVGLELLLYVICTIAVVYICLFLDNFKPIVVLFLAGLFSMSRNGVKSGESFFTVKTNLIVLICCASIVVISIIARFIIYKQWKLFSKTKFNMKWGFLAITISFLLSGLFSSDYKPINIVIALVKACSFSLIYFYLVATEPLDKNGFNYLADVVCIFAIEVILQIVLMYIIDRNIIFDASGAIIREKLDLGWCGHNSVGSLLILMLPFAFYNAYTKKRGYVYTILAICIFGATILTMSRASMAIAFIGFIVGSIYLLIKGNNRKVNIIIYSVLIIGGIAFIIIFWNKIYSLLQSIISLGFSLNGRERVYSRGINDFLSNPIFGVGYSLNNLDGVWEKLFYFGKYHNIIIEILATSGIFGVIAFSIYFYQLAKVLHKKVDTVRFVVILAMCLFMLNGMLDRIFFIPGMNCAFSLFIAIMDKYSINDENANKMLGNY